MQRISKTPARLFSDLFESDYIEGTQKATVKHPMPAETRS